MMNEPTAEAHWVFDLDGTLVDGLAASRLRPGAAELLRRLAADGMRLSLWSAGGAAYALRVATRLGVDALFSAVGEKVAGDDGRWVLPVGWQVAGGVVCVDDEPGRLPLDVGALPVRPWLGGAHDNVLVHLDVSRPAPRRLGMQLASSELGHGVSHPPGGAPETDAQP